MIINIMSLILLLFINISFCYGNSLYGQTNLFANADRLNLDCNDLNSIQLEIKDTLRTRYYEAPYDESPFGTFRIIDTSSVIVYTQKKSHKRYGSYLKYYYSLNIKSRIHELSLENLEVDFADNNKFLESVKKTNVPLGKIINGITVINKLLLESLKK